MRCVLIQLEYQEDEKMTITVAGNRKEYEDGINLPTLIEKEQIDNADYVTVTINDEFVERSFRRRSSKMGTW